MGLRTLMRLKVPMRFMRLMRLKGPMRFMGLMRLTYGMANISQDNILGFPDTAIPRPASGSPHKDR